MPCRLCAAAWRCRLPPPTAPRPARTSSAARSASVRCGCAATACWSCCRAAAGQQGGRRPGTENVAGLRAFARQATALAAAAADHRRHAARLCERLLAGADAPAPGGGAARARRAAGVVFAPTSSACPPPAFRPRVLVRVLSDEGVYLSRGSACSSSGPEDLARAAGDGRARAGRGRRVPGFDRVEHYRVRRRPPAQSLGRRCRRCGRSRSAATRRSGPHR